MTATPTLERPVDGRAAGCRRADAAPARRARLRPRLGVHRVLRRVRLGDRPGEADRQLVLLAPADRRVHPRPRHPAPRRVLVHRARHQVGGAVVARRGDVRVARTAAWAGSASGCSSVWSVPASGSSPTAWRSGSSATGSCACGLTAAALAGIYTVWSERPLLDRRALPARAALGRRGPRQHRRAPPAGGRPGADVAVGEHARHLRARLRVPRPAPPRPLARRATAVGRPRSDASSSGAAIAFAVVFVNPYGVELVTFPIDLLSRGDILSHIVEWQSPDFRQAWGVALAIWIVVFVVRAGPRAPPGHAPRPRRRGADAAARAVGGAQRRDRTAHRPAGRRPGVRP